MKEANWSCWNGGVCYSQKFVMWRMLSLDVLNIFQTMLMTMRERFDRKSVCRVKNYLLKKWKIYWLNKIIMRMVRFVQWLLQYCFLHFITFDAVGWNCLCSKAKSAEIHTSISYLGNNLFRSFWFNRFFNKFILRKRKVHN